MELTEVIVSLLYTVTLIFNQLFAANQNELTLAIHNLAIRFGLHPPRAIQFQQGRHYVRPAEQHDSSRLVVTHTD